MQSQYQDQRGYDSNRQKKQRMLDVEFAELTRVGNIPFSGYLPKELVAFNLSVIKRRA